MIEINYDKLLDDWADHIYSKIKNGEEGQQDTELGSYKYGVWAGYIMGLTEALSDLSFLENRMIKDYITSYQECWNKSGCIFNSNISPKYKKCWQENYSVEQCEKDNKNQGGSCL